MVDASGIFGLFASFLSKLGFFLFLPLGIGLYFFASAGRFDSDNSKRKIADLYKLALMIFAGLQLPVILVKLIS
ncbi:hypothetical protein HY419_01720 [candidate division WWE3 bacterium]|nr:hypothetical protein [candidate division WWE3 bacterium]